MASSSLLALCRLSMSVSHVCSHNALYTHSCCDPSLLLLQASPGPCAAFSKAIYIISDGATERADMNFSVTRAQLRESHHTCP